MKLRQGERRIMAKVRREANIEKYQALLKTNVPQKLEGITYTDQDQWNELCVDKLKKAEKEVKILEERISFVSD